MKNKIALVTGASSGIGAATARRLAQAGYTVYGTSRRGAQAGGHGHAMLALDVTSDASVAAAVAAVMQAEGRIDLLVNNAGFGVAPAGAEESSIEQAQAIFDTNFFGVVRMTRAVLPHMRAQGGGRILNIGSVLGFLPMPYGALYAATKHAIEGYTESLDHEVRGWNIRASVIEPAYTKTTFEANLLPPDAPLAAYETVRTGITRRLLDIMAGAEGPDVVAGTVLAAAEAPRPQLRYTSGPLAARLRLMRRFLPAALMDGGLRKDLRLA
jgi:NAD(P)-dependent dehydrogenase (short-subunit alcohol dehydrogenase family)